VRARAVSLRGTKAQALSLGIAAMLFCAQVAAAVEVVLDNAPGVVLLPDNWRPIPRAEIVEARERAAQATGEASGPLPVAAFQRLPTLQWFSLPHALLFWERAQPPGVDGMAADTAAAPGHPDLQLSEDLGRGPRGALIHAWHCSVTRHDGRFRIELLTPDDDGRDVIIGLAEGLREHPQPTPGSTRQP
jgi:hypothetical protein